MSGYPLDLPGSGLLTKLANQPYPAMPDGIFVSRAVYEVTLSPWTPLVCGALYELSVKVANARQARKVAAHKRGEAPAPKDHIKASWTLSQLVLAHNAFLALYSGWTFLHTMVRIVPYFFNGIRQGGMSGLGNAYCTVPTSDPHGLGRFVWFFYMSKFYEFVDSFILMAKGKKVGTLQSYHHLGAALAMWAGLRYSAPAIWIFLAFNSLVHTLMYSYYTFSTLRLPFASALKKSMTTTQITQLIVGCFIASTYLFVQYSPLAYSSGSLPSIGDLDDALGKNPLYASLRQMIISSGEKTGFAGMLAAATSANPTRSSTGSSPAVSTTMLLRNGLLHAAGDQGYVSCCASTGQAFAVILNVVYLLPLICLFVQFYVRSYSKGKAVSTKPAGKSL